MDLEQEPGSGGMERFLLFSQALDSLRPVPAEPSKVFVGGIWRDFLRLKSRWLSIPGRCVGFFGHQVVPKTCPHQ